MRKNFYILGFIFALIPSFSNAQCVFGDMQFASGTAPATIGTTTMITTCNYYGEYSPIDGFNTAFTYSLNITDGGYITVFTTGNIAVAWGPAPLSFTPPADGTYHVQWSGPGCTTDFDCHETNVTNTGNSAPCTDPAAAGTTVSNTTSACVGQTINLSLSGASVGSGMVYQWESSTDGTNYTPIAGATSASHGATQSVATYYRCIVTCGAGTPSTSTPIMVGMGNCLIMSNTTEITCDANFFDPAGPTANYANGQNVTMTIYPSSAGSFLQVLFNSFNLETCCDYLAIYNGNSTAAPLIGQFYTNPGGITSSATDGSLTFQFYTDGSVVYSGWEAVLTCVTAPTNDECATPIAILVNGNSNTFNNGGASVASGETILAPPATGEYTTDGWGASNLNRTTWFTFVGPASGNLSIDCTDQPFPGRVAIYEGGNCSDYSSFELVAANDNALDFSSSAPKFTVCGLTPGATYYLLHDSDSPASSGQFSIKLTEIDLNAGDLVDTLEVCAGESVDLFDGITGNDAGGMWSEMIPTVNLSGSTFNTNGLAYQVFEFEYYVENGCANDAVAAFVHIYGPSSAGEDGSLTVCRNAPINLFGGLNGNVDMGGTWYNPSLQEVPSLTTASNIPGQFNFYYVSGNGICEDDTALVVVNVDPGCNYLNIEEMYFAEMTLHPNPTDGVFYISNSAANLSFNVDVLDINGRILSSKEQAINGTDEIQIDLSENERGIYMVRVYNDEAQKVFRVVLQ
jgi:hypothetical protein